jgi:GMP synthase (glutamine-hydrolysing)
MYAGDGLPDLDRLAGLVVLGGPMGVGDVEAHRHLAAEQDLLRRALAAELPILGVCLGAQLLARALGSEVRRGPEPEVGLGAVVLTGDGRTDPVLGPAGPLVPVLHWHQDTFDIPPGAVRLASSPAYPNQAFRVGRVAYGFQFHVELDRGLAGALRPHLPPGTSIAGPGRAAVERIGTGILDRFFELAGAVRRTPGRATSLDGQSDAHSPMRHPPAHHAVGVDDQEAPRRTRDHEPPGQQGQVAIQPDVTAHRNAGHVGVSGEPQA